MVLRLATPQDYESIVRLVPTQTELFLVYPKGKYPFTVDQVEFLAESRKELTVCINNDDVVAFANLYDIEPGQHGFVGNVIVSHNYRGQGIGRQLVTHMIQQAFNKYAVSEVRISVFNDNTPALLLYTALNFKPYAIETRINPLGKRVGLIHMRIGQGD